MKRSLFIGLLLVSLATVAGPLEKKKIKVGKTTLTVEIAQTDLERAKGLMYRRELGPNQGMLFVFEEEEPLSFWMKNTFIPLSIGYFNAKKVLIDIQEMDPVKSEMESSPPSYKSSGPAQYALEMPRGWFKKNKITLGAKLSLP